MLGKQYGEDTVIRHRPRKQPPKPLLPDEMNHQEGKDSAVDLGRPKSIGSASVVDANDMIGASIATVAEGKRQGEEGVAPARANAANKVLDAEEKKEEGEARKHAAKAPTSQPDPPSSAQPAKSAQRGFADGGPVSPAAAVVSFEDAAPRASRTPSRSPSTTSSTHGGRVATASEHRLQQQAAAAAGNIDRGKSSSSNVGQAGVLAGAARLLGKGSKYATSAVEHTERRVIVPTCPHPK